MVRGMLTLLAAAAWTITAAQEPAGNGPGSVPDNLPGKKFIHRLGVEYRPEYIFPSNPFVAGRNASGQPIDFAQSLHLRYALQYRPGTAAARIYGDVYQGVGIARYDFGSPSETGDPVAVYLFQGRASPAWRRVSRSTTSGTSASRSAGTPTIPIRTAGTA